MYCISRQLQQKNEVMDLYVCFYYYHKEEDHDFTRYAVISMLYKGTGARTQVRARNDYHDAAV